MVDNAEFRLNLLLQDVLKYNPGQIEDTVLEKKDGEIGFTLKEISNDNSGISIKVLFDEKSTAEYNWFITRTDSSIGEIVERRGRDILNLIYVLCRGNYEWFEKLPIPQKYLVDHNFAIKIKGSKTWHSYKTKDQITEEISIYQQNKSLIIRNLITDQEIIRNNYE